MDIFIGITWIFKRSKGEEALNEADTKTLKDSKIKSYLKFE